MGADERRRSVLKHLCRCRYATIAELAATFDVSECTIRRDVETLSLSEPIYTQPGRHGGGVYVVEGYYMDYIYFSPDELTVLNKVLAHLTEHTNEELSSEEIASFRKMIIEHTKP